MHDRSLGLPPCPCIIISMHTDDMVGYTACCVYDLHQHSSVHSMYVVIDVHCSMSLSIQDGLTPLIIASFFGHVDVVRVLIEAHADVHLQDEVWYTGQPVHRLCDYSALL